MNYADIKRFDISNGPGVRLSLFVSGCTHHCKGCFNQVAWDFNYGKPFTQETIDMILKELDHSYYSGLTLLGGEPMEPQNQIALLPLLKEVKRHFPEKNIWCFTGYLFDRDIMERMLWDCEATEGMLDCIDVMVDGPFMEELKGDDLYFKGSSNQRTIDVQKSRKQQQVVIWEHKEYVHVDVNENPSGGLT